MKNLAERNISQEYRLENVYETRNYFIEETSQTEMMNNKHKNVCAVFTYYFSVYGYWNVFQFLVFLLFVDILIIIVSSVVEIELNTIMPYGFIK